MYTVLLVIHSIVVVFLIMMVLIQRTDSDGLSGLSGGGGNQFMTGRAQANLMTRITAILAGVFMLTSLTLAIMASNMTSKSIVDSVTPPVEQPAPVEMPKTEAPAAAPVAPAQPTPAVPKPE